MTRDQSSLKGGYQDALRVIGAWLDARGFHDVRIVEQSGALTVEAQAAGSSRKESLRLDSDRIMRLRLAAVGDRGGALSLPVPEGPEPLRRPR